MESSSPSRPVDALTVIRNYVSWMESILCSIEAAGILRSRFGYSGPPPSEAVYPQNALGLAEFIRTAQPETPWSELATALDKRFSTDYVTDSKLHQALLDSVLAWSRYGKRVYHIPEDLQRVLEVTSASSHSWRDISFPLQSFAIELTKPIVEVVNGLLHQVSTIIVTAYAVDSADTASSSREPSIVICVLGDDFCKYRARHHHEKRELLEKARRANRRHASRLDEEFRTFEEYNASQLLFDGWAIFDTMLDKPIRTPTDDALRAIPNLEDYCDDPSIILGNTERLHFWERVSKLVANFLIFLESAHHATYSSSGAQATKRTPTKAHDPVSGAERVELKHTFTLTDEEQTVLDRVIGATDRTAVLELGAHFRAAHWRRPPGKGHDLEAAKTVHVKWTIVNLEKLLAGEIPAPRVARVTTSAR